MAYVDSQLELSNGQVVTATADSTNIVDFGVGDIGVGDPDVILCVQVDQTCTAAGSATVQVQLITDDDPAFGTPTVAVQTAPIAIASLVAGARVTALEPPIGMKRYAKVSYVVATGPLTAGAFSAFFTLDVDAQKAYKSGFTV